MEECVIRKAAYQIHRKLTLKNFLQKGKLGFSLNTLSRRKWLI